MLNHQTSYLYLQVIADQGGVKDRGTQRGRGGPEGAGAGATHRQHHLTSHALPQRAIVQLKATLLHTVTGLHVKTSSLVWAWQKPHHWSGHDKGIDTKPHHLSAHDKTSSLVWAWQRHGYKTSSLDCAWQRHWYETSSLICTRQKYWYKTQLFSSLNYMQTASNCTKQLYVYIAATCPYIYCILEHINLDFKKHVTFVSVFKL